ncbi:cytochrome P450 [Aspergillus carlsbadensis]|nr:cytochrome P450 [Aspergillus carlsbadensis]
MALISRLNLGGLLETGLLILYLTCLALAWLTARSIYRLWFHPLRNIPGPKLAPVTHLYELYFDAAKGPVVRINPREVHIKDSDLFHVIYPGGRRDRDPKSFINELLPTSVTVTVGHDHHKLRRHIISGFFSKLSVIRLDEMIRDKLHSVLNALTLDIIPEYMYGESLGNLDLDLASSSNTVTHGAVSVIQWLHYVRVFPPMVATRTCCANHLLRGDQSLVGPLLRVFQLTRDNALKCLAVAATGTSGSSYGHGKREKTILRAMAADSVPPQEKSFERLTMEAVAILSAGTDTTARTAAVALFHLAHNPAILRTLRIELLRVFLVSVDKVPWSQRNVSAGQLEKLPYLTAVVQESIRVTHPVIMRSARVAAEPVRYKNTTPMSQSVHFVCMDPKIFPYPQIFNPDRWIEAAAKGVNLIKYLAAFGTGHRSCLGTHLAYAELYHVIAALACSFEWELHETGLEDVRITRDFQLAVPESGSLAIKILLTGTVG